MTIEKQTQLRHEFKYEIDKLEYQVLQRKLSVILSLTQTCNYTGTITCEVSTLMTVKTQRYIRKRLGFFDAKKYRLRIYNHSDAYIKFERKTKIGQYMLKENIRITRSEADRLIAKKYDFLAETENKLLRDFYAETRCNLMRPVSVVEYDREAYIHPIGKVRVTFDTGLRTTLACIDLFNKKACMMAARSQPGIILEVKYNEVLPKFICGLFPDTIKPKLAIGKFVICRNQQMNQRGV